MTGPNPQDAIQYLMRLRDAESSFLGFVRLVHPEYKLAPFQLELIEALDKLEKGTLVNAQGKPVRSLMINMPPRHGKSFIASWLFPVYYIARNPRRAVLAASYNETLATDFGRKTRNYASEPFMQQAFPDFAIRDDSKAADFWATTEGGQYAGVGLGGTTTGRPANLLLVDDPIRNRPDAESATKRNNTWDFYTGSLMNRKQPVDKWDGSGIEDPIEIIILTRWHPDDLAGRLQDSEDWKEGRWHHINLPAIRGAEPKKIMRCDLPADDPDYLKGQEYRALAPGKRYVLRTDEQALWPERFNLEYLHRLKRMNERDFAALFMQKPYIQGGNRIKSHWWRTYDTLPDWSEFAAIVIGLDTAFKSNKDNDYSAFCVGGLHHNGDIYLIDMIRGKWDFPSLKRMATTINVKYRGKGLRAFYIEDKASGQSLIQELRTGTGIAVVPVKVVYDKVQRVDLVSPLIEGGRVLIPKEATWLDPFMDEVNSFPSGTNDDQVDAMVITLDQLSKTSMNDHAMMNMPLGLGNSLFQQVARQTGGMSGKGSINDAINGLNAPFSWGE